jgi:hypothetical protein
MSYADCKTIPSALSTRQMKEQEAWFFEGTDIGIVAS